MVEEENLLEKILEKIENDHNHLVQTQEKVISIEGFIESENKRLNRLNTRVSNLEEHQRMPSKLEIIMNKTSATGIGIIVIVIGIFCAVIIGMVIGGIDVAVQIWETLGWFLPILAMYFGISSQANVKQMLEKVLKELAHKGEKKDDGK